MRGNDEAGGLVSFKRGKASEPDAEFVTDNHDLQPSIALLRVEWLRLRSEDRTHEESTSQRLQGQSDIDSRRTIRWSHGRSDR